MDGTQLEPAQQLEDNTLLPYAITYFRRKGLRLEIGKEYEVAAFFRTLLRDAVEHKLHEGGPEATKMAINHIFVRFGFSFPDAEDFVRYITHHPSPTD